MIPKDTPVGTRVRVLKNCTSMIGQETIIVVNDGTDNYPLRIKCPDYNSLMNYEDVELVEPSSSPVSHFLNHNKLFSQS